MVFRLVVTVIIVVCRKTCQNMLHIFINRSIWRQLWMIGHLISFVVASVKLTIDKFTPIILSSKQQIMQKMNGKYYIEGLCIGIAWMTGQHFDRISIIVNGHNISMIRPLHTHTYILYNLFSHINHANIFFKAEIWKSAENVCKKITFCDLLVRAESGIAYNATIRMEFLKYEKNPNGLIIQVRRSIAFFANSSIFINWK